MSIVVDEIEKNIIEERLMGTLSEDDLKIIEQKKNNNDIAEKVDINDLINKMNNTSVNCSYKHIYAIGNKGKVIKLIKKVIRKLVFWYVEPCMMQQTEYNTANSSFAMKVNSEINEITKRNNKLSSDINTIIELQKQLQQKIEIIEKLQEKVEGIEKLLKK